MSGGLDEIGYQLKELNKNIKELTEKLGLLEELSELSNIDSSISKLLEIQKEHVNRLEDIIEGGGSG